MYYITGTGRNITGTGHLGDPLGTPSFNSHSK